MKPRGATALVDYHRPGLVLHSAGRHRATRAAAKMLRVKPATEQRYVGALRLVMRGVRHAGEAWLAPHLSKFARADAANPTAIDFEAYIAELSNKIGQRVLPAFGHMSAAIAKQNLMALQEMGLDVRHEGSVAAMIAHLRDWNIRLLSQASSEYAADVTSVLEAPENWALRVEELAALISERGDVAESHAMMIARDQVSKTNGGINRIRQQSAGGTKYTWSGSLDERERPEHLANEGKVFDWNVPPQETGHPSEDVNCRCVAVVFIEEIDGPDDSES